MNNDQTVKTEHTKPKRKLNVNKRTIILSIVTLVILAELIYVIYYFTNDERAGKKILNESGTTKYIDDVFARTTETNKNIIDLKPYYEIIASDALTKYQFSSSTDAKDNGLRFVKYSDFVTEYERLYNTKPNINKAPFCIAVESLEIIGINHYKSTEDNTLVCDETNQDIAYITYYRMAEPEATISYSNIKVKNKTITATAIKKYEIDGYKATLKGNFKLKYKKKSGEYKVESLEFKSIDDIEYK